MGRRRAGFRHGASHFRWRPSLDASAQDGCGPGRSATDLGAGGAERGLVVVNRERGRTASERDRAENALIEVRREKERADQALIAETIARQRTREVLDDTTSEVVEKFLAAQGSKLGPDQEAFLKKMLVSYREFAAETGDSEESRAAVAQAHARVGMLHYKMGQLQNCRDSWQRSTELYGKLAAEYPERTTFRHLQASNQRNLALVDVEAGRVKDAEQALRAILELSAGWSAIIRRNSN